jgi:uncharacterized protein with ATP-grasp and redox domains
LRFSDFGGALLKARPDCIPCIIAHVLKVAQNVTPDDWLARKAILETMDLLKTAEFDRTPAEIAYDCLHLTARTLGTSDPFKEEKRQANEAALAVIGDAQKLALESKDDPLFTLLRFAAAANLLDTGILSTATPEDVILLTSKMDFEVNNYSAFKKDLKSSKSILYILDNAGEIVFDKLVVEGLVQREKRVTAVVRRSPILNDALREDARLTGMDSLCQIIDTGVDSLGVILSVSSAQFREAFENADMVISKGQANFETLEGVHKNIYFLMSAKCDVIANHLGISKGDLVLLKE